MLLFLRSLAFRFYFYVMSLFVIISNAPRVMRNPSHAHFVYKRWGYLTAWGLKNICHINIAVRGGEHIPKNGALLACKHQSVLETAVLFAIIEHPAMILKQELKNIPFAKHYIKGAGHIPIDRKSGSQSRNFIITEAQKRFENGQSVLIFPEGTRTSVNAPPRYKRGIFGIYEKLRIDCIPIALNTGLFWSKDQFLCPSGTVIFEFLPPIKAGMAESEFMTELTTKIESTVARLVQEAVAEQTDLRRKKNDSKMVISNNMYLKHLKIIFERQKNDVISVILFFISLTYYLLLLHTNMAHAHDSPSYYHNIITANVSWHAHHVLYEPLSFLWSEYGKLIIPSLHPFKLISAINCFFGAGCISLIYLIFTKRLLFSIQKALIGCLIIGSSFYFLNYATTVEVYHSALFFMLATFYYATKTHLISYKDAMIIGILHGFAMSFHQMHFLMGLVLLPRMLKAGYWQFFIYVLYGTIIVFFIYLMACYAEHIHSLTEFKTYFLGYMSNEKIIKGNSSALLAPLGLGIALLGGRYIMAINPFRSFIENHFADSEFDRIFYLHHKTSVLLGTIQILLYCLFIVCFFIIFKKYIKMINIKRIKMHYEYYSLILIYSLFFTFWYPHNPEFWGVSLTFMIIVLMIQINNLKLLCTLGLSVFMINLFGSGLPLLDFENNLYPNGISSLF